MFKILSTYCGGGYTYCRTEPLHPKANTKGLYPLHRVLLENKLGRLLGTDEIAHHVDGDKSNNSLSNIALLTRSEHSKLHRKVELVVCECPVCKSKFTMKPNLFRLRFSRRNSKPPTCSRKCGGIIGWRLRRGLS